MLFEEDKQWNWGEEHTVHKDDNLEWSNPEDTEQREEEIQEDQAAELNSESSLDESTEEESPVSRRAVTRQGRTINPPAWMRDYVSGEGISDEEVNMVHEYATEDPVCYEEVCKLEKWRIALEFCGTHDQLADIMTKPLKKDAFLKFRKGMGMCTEEEII